MYDPAATESKDRATRATCIAALLSAMIVLLTIAPPLFAMLL